MTIGTIKFSEFSLPKVLGGNGDRFAVGNHENLLFCAIADGVGSSTDPGLSAETVIETVKNILETSPVSSIESIFSAAKKSIVEKTKSFENDVSLKTTLSICLIENGNARVGHVGDSRIYHLRGSGLVTRTKDQTEVQHLIDEGILTPERAKMYPRKNVLLSAISSESEYTLSQGNFDVQPKDRLLFLTDGAYRELLKTEIIKLSNESTSIDSLIRKLQDQIKITGHSDDATVLGIEIE